MSDIHLDQIKVDGDDLSDVLVELEYSFGVALPRDLRHVQTAGDLFNEILRCRQPDGSGDRCDTAMAFYLLRRRLAAMGLDPKAGPQMELPSQCLTSPRQVAALLKRELGLQPPPLVVSYWSLSVAFIVMLAAVGLAWWFWSASLIAFWLLVIPVLAMDRGSWTGDWATLGSLSEAVAIRNVAFFTSGGARSTEARWWKRFTQILADISSDGSKKQMDHKAIGKSTRFESQ